MKKLPERADISKEYFPFWWKKTKPYSHPIITNYEKLLELSPSLRLFRQFITVKLSKLVCTNTYASTLWLDQFPLLFGNARVFQDHGALRAVSSIRLKKINK